METFACIDWLGFTDTQRKPGAGYLTPDFLINEPTAPAVARFGYRKAVTTPTGPIIMFDGSTDTMGVHYQYSGRAIANLLEAGTHPYAILAYHHEQGHRCTRIDLAIDVYGLPEYAQRLARLAEAGKFEGSCRSINIVRSLSDNGLTLYCGSRQSERFVRIYDKAIEMHRPGDWTRIEVELKSSTARGIANMLARAPVGDLFMHIKSILRPLIDFVDNDWTDIMAGDTVPIVSPQPKERDTEKWLLTQVAMAIARYGKAHPERRILDRLVEAVEGITGDLLVYPENH